MRPDTFVFKCSDDPNNNFALLKLKNGVVFFDAKMGVDADGSLYAIKTPGETDQAETSFKYPNHKLSINSDNVPYIVIPKGEFGKDTGVELGDLAAVVYENKVIFSIVADEGPLCKIGEGSIQLHELLNNKVCKERSSNGDCKKIHDVSIEKNVLYFIFPGTKRAIFDGLTPQNINSRIQEIGEKEWDRLKIK